MEPTVTQHGTSRSRLLVIISVVVLLAAGSVFWLAPKKRPEMRPRPRGFGFPKPHIINREMVEHLELLVDGKPFGSAVHTGRLGGSVRFSGSFVPVADKLPKGDFDLDIWVAHYPVGTGEDVWKKGSPRTTRLIPGVIDGEVVQEKDRIGGTLVLEPETFQPGEYELRAYLGIADMEGEEDHFDYLGNAILRVE